MRMDVVLVPRPFLGTTASGIAARERIARALAGRYPIERQGDWIVIHFPEPATEEAAIAQVVRDLNRFERRWPLAVKIGLRNGLTRRAELRALLRGRD